MLGYHSLPQDFQRKLAAARKDADDRLGLRRLFFRDASAAGRCNALQESLVNKLHSTRRAAEKAGLESKVDANIQSDAPLLVSNLQTALGSTRHGTPEQLEMAEETPVEIDRHENCETTGVASWSGCFEIIEHEQKGIYSCEQVFSFSAGADAGQNAVWAASKSVALKGPLSPSN